MSLFQVSRNFRKLGSPANFAGVQKTATFNKITPKLAEKYLTSLDTYTKFKHTRKPKRYNPYYAYVPNEYVQFDLIDLSKLSRFNHGTKFLLTGIDTFTRFSIIVLDITLFFSFQSPHPIIYFN